MIRRPLFCLLIAVFAISCDTSNPNYAEEVAQADFLHDGMKHFSDVIVYDIFSPPQAARNYAYASIAAYEVIARFDQNYRSLVGQIHEFTDIPESSNENVNPHIASMEAFYQTANHFIFNEDKFLTKHQDWIDELDVIGVPQKVITASREYGGEVAKHVIEFSDSDNYKQTRTFPKYSITKDPSKWKPTPPGYGDGIEPHWNKIRPFVIDSADQFIPTPPTPFDMTKGSKFYKETMEVYEVVNSTDDEQKEIASFWDCNPYALNVTGHVMHATKKITPGGHWISIVAIASRKAGVDYAKSAEAYALVSIALHDAFISCWDEKYRSSLVRPETVINEHIDENWVPILQTPPFPEHTSGHSVISRAAAIAMTKLFGENFAFDDDTEVQYGIPIRSFESFLQASDEAAVSRLYGGIHYRPAIDYGVAQGEKVGTYIIDKIELSSPAQS